jgi:hypothetical protein
MVACLPDESMTGDPCVPACRSCGRPAGDIVITAEDGAEAIGRALPANDRAPE